MNEPVLSKLKLPESATLDVNAVMYDYDRPSDTLTVHLLGRGRPAMILHSGGHVDLLLDPTTEEVVGFQIEGYLAHVVRQDPRFLSLADLAGIDTAEIDRVRQTITPDRRRRAGVALLADLLRASA